MRVGITGTQIGATEGQVAALSQLLERLGATELHHGDCVGADAQAHAVARTLGLRVVVYPPSNPAKRAWCQGDVTMPPQPYLERNRAIVNATEYLIALPKTKVEEMRSGTWATVRYARKLNRRIAIL